MVLLFVGRSWVWVRRGRPLCLELLELIFLRIYSVVERKIGLLRQMGRD